jgi:hypothetical protein
VLEAVLVYKTSDEVLATCKSEDILLGELELELAVSRDVELGKFDEVAVVEPDEAELVQSDDVGIKISVKLELDPSEEAEVRETLKSVPVGEYIDTPKDAELEDNVALELTKESVDENPGELELEGLVEMGSETLVQVLESVNRLELEDPDEV